MRTYTRMKNARLESGLNLGTADCQERKIPSDVYVYESCQSRDLVIVVLDAYSTQPCILFG